MTDCVDAPPRVVTTIGLAPTVPAGVVAVIEVPKLFTSTLVANTPPIVTLLVLRRLIPTMVIFVPPAIVPDDGLTEVMLGGAM